MIKQSKCNLTCLPDVTIKYVDDILRVSIMGIYERKDFDEMKYIVSFKVFKVILSSRMKSSGKNSFHYYVNAIIDSTIYYIYEI